MEVRVAAVAALLDRARAIGGARGVAVRWELRMDAPAVAMDPRARRRAGRGVRVAAPQLSSGARATTRSRWRRPCPVTACSSSCAGGVSHTPAEFVDPADAEAALDVLVAAVCALAVR